MIAIALAIAMAALLQTPAPSKPPAPPMVPMTIDKGDQSNVDDAKQVVARTETEWAALWNRHAPDRKRPAVIFSSQMVVGIFMGSRPTAGYSVAIVSTIQANGVLTVRYRESFPPRDAITAQVITSPFVLVTVPAFAGDVRFEKTDK
jgi:hypothetical protein